MTRNGATGAPELEGDYLINAQGEDVVAGTRATRPIDDLAREMPEVYAELREIATAPRAATTATCRTSSSPSRTGTAVAAADPRRQADRPGGGADRGRPGRRGADHPRGRGAPGEARAGRLLPASPAVGGGRARPTRRDAVLATGLNVSPGAAVGIVAFDPDLAERWAPARAARSSWSAPRPSPTTCTACSPPRASSPAAVAVPATPRWWPASSASRPWSARPPSRSTSPTGRCRRRRHVIDEGDWVSIDGTTGEVYAGELETFVPDLTDRLAGRACCRGPTGSAASASGPTPTIPTTPIRARSYGAEGHRPVPHRAHVLRARTAADRAADDHERRARPSGERRSQLAAAAARRLPRPVRGDGRPAGHHPAHRPAPARVPAPPARSWSKEVTDAKIRLPAAASLEADRRARWRRSSARGAARTRSSACARPTRCSGCAASVSAWSTPRSSGCRSGRSSRRRATCVTAGSTSGRRS